VGVIALIYVVLWTVLLGAFTGLPILLIMLCVPPWRRALLRHPRKLAVLALVCVSVVGATLFQVAVSYRDNLIRNPKLDHAVQVEGLVLPAGTRLHLGAIEPLDGSGLPQIHGLASLQSADFPAPNTVRGLRVLALQIFRPQEVQLTLAGDQEVEGWPCRGGSRVTMVATEQTRLQPDHWQFSDCELVPGTPIAGVSWPEGSHLYKQDVGYTVGYFGSAQTTSIDGIELTYASIKLDALRTLVHWEGKLKNPLTLGEWTYPPGMRVGQNAPSTLIFRADRYYTGRNLHTGKGLSPGQSIEQHVLDGSELWIKPDTEVEGFNF
jgi:hypothetical protein